MTTLNTSGSQQYVDFDQYIDHQLQKTRSGIKTTDLLTAGAGLLVLVLSYLLVFVVLDHWVIPGGFSRGMRLGMLALVTVAGVAWIGWKIVRPWMRNVNRLYAARELEKADPTLQSTLLNLVDAEQAGREVSPAIRSAMEKRAAVNLSAADVDSAVDRKMLLTLCYALLAVVVLWAGYTRFSTKKISTSIWRALAPASATAVDTKTDILNIEPGDVEILAGSLLPVRVELGGEIPDQVTLLYSTTDRRFVDAPVELRRVDEEGPLFETVLRGASGTGIEGDLTWRIVAGDTESETFRVTVIQPPHGRVNQVTYTHPEYQGKDPNPQVQDSPEVEAYEGTLVTIRATFDQKVLRAEVKLSDTEDFEKTSDVYSLSAVDESKTVWEGSFPLAMRSDGTRPHFYHVNGQNRRGDSDPEPIMYPVTIRPDLPPEVVLVGPAEDIERPANAVVPVTIKANDPDFKLRYVTLKLKTRDGDPIYSISVLDELKTNLEGTFDLDLKNVPGPLKTGDEVFLQVEARDNRRIQLYGRVIPGNRTTVPAEPGIRITITDPAPEEQVEQQANQDRQQQQDQLEQRDPNRNGDPQQENNPQPNNDPDANQNQNREPGEEGEGEADPNQKGEGTDRGNPGDGTQNEGEPGAESEGTPDGMGDPDSNRDPNTEPNGDGAEGKTGSDNNQQRNEKPLDDTGRDDQEILEKLRQHQKEQRERAEAEQQQQPNRDRDPESGSSSDPESGTGSDPMNNSDPEMGTDAENTTDPESDGMENSGTDSGTRSESDTTDNGAEQRNPEPGTTDEGMGNPDGMNPENTSDRGTDPEARPDPSTEDSGTEEGMNDRSGTGSEDKPGPDSATDPEMDGMSKTGTGENPEAGEEGTGDPKGTRPDGDPSTETDMNQTPRSDMGTDPMQTDSANPDADSNADPGTEGENTTDPNSTPDNSSADMSETGMEGGTDSMEGTASDPEETTDRGTGTEQNSTMDDPQGMGGGNERKTDPNGDPNAEKTDGMTDPKNSKVDDGMGDPNKGTPNPGERPEAGPEQEGTPGSGSEQKEDPNPNENDRGPGERTGSQNPEDADPTRKTNQGTDPMETPDQRPSETPENSPKRDRAGTDNDQSNARNPDLKNGEQKPRKSDQSDGGETGNTTGADQGNRSNKTGSGDSAMEEGTEEKSTQKTGTEGTEEGEGSSTRKSDSPDARSDTEPRSEGEPEKSTNPDRTPQQDPGATDERNPTTDGNRPDSPEGSDPKPNGDPSKSPDGQQNDNPPDMGDPAGGENPMGQGEGPKGKPGEQPSKQPGQGEGTNPEGPGNGRNGGGATENGARPNGPAPETNLQPGEEANLNNGKQAANLTLKKLQDEIERGEVDPELLKELGWSEDRLKSWTERMQQKLDAVDEPATTSIPETERIQVEEMLKNFGSKRSGESVKSRDSGGVGPRDIPVPAKYRKLYEAYTRSLSGKED